MEVIQTTEVLGNENTELDNCFNIRKIFADHKLAGKFEEKSSKLRTNRKTMRNRFGPLSP